MKKLFAILLCLAFLFSYASADETLQLNERYNFVEHEPFFFVVPDGFAIDDSNTYSNGNEWFYVDLLVGDFVKELIRPYEDNHSEMLEFVGGMLNGLMTDHLKEVLRCEMSGGCYKISCVFDRNGEDCFCILALCEEGILSVVIGPVENALSFDLEHGIFKTLTYQKRK